MKRLILLSLFVVSVALFAGCQKTADPIPTQQEPITYTGDGPWIIQTKYETDDVVVADIIVDPEKYNVDPTGKKDSTTGIQKALNDARQMDGGTVWLPAGQYLISRPITIPAFVTLRGDWQDPDLGNEYGTVLVNGGLDAGGFDLATDDSGIYYLQGYSDMKSWNLVGEAECPVSNDFVFTDYTDLDIGSVTYSAEDLLNDVPEYGYQPQNTSIRIENGLVVTMERIYTP
jgi:hypothetical protein